MSTNNLVADVGQFRDSWFEGAIKLADQMNPAGLMPSVDLETAVDRYFIYLVDGLRVNQQFIVDLASSIPGAAEDGMGPARAVMGAALGHAKAISTWIADEIKTVSLPA